MRLLMLGRSVLPSRSSRWRGARTCCAPTASSGRPTAVALNRAASAMADSQALLEAMVDLHAARRSGQEILTRLALRA